MLSKKKKIIILCAMMLLLVLTGYLNLRLNGSVIPISSLNNNTTNTNTNFFTNHRDYRTETRNQEMLYYDAIISSTASTSEAIATAQTKKMEIVSLMEKELVIEGLIKGKGFEDCVVVISDDSVKAIIKSSDALDKSQVAQITSILQEQLKTDIGNIVITNI